MCLFIVEVLLSLLALRLWHSCICDRTDLLFGTCLVTFHLAMMKLLLALVRVPHNLLAVVQNRCRHHYWYYFNHMFQRGRDKINFYANNKLCSDRKTSRFTRLNVAHE